MKSLGKKVELLWQANGYRLPTEAEWEFAARERGKKIRFGNGKNEAVPGEINFKNLSINNPSDIDTLKTNLLEVDSLMHNFLRDFSYIRECL